MQIFLKPIEDLGMIAWLVPVMLVIIVLINYYGLWSKWVVNDLGLEELCVASYTFDPARMERGRRTLAYTLKIRSLEKGVDDERVKLLR
jgi:hypothetical protein